MKYPVVKNLGRSYTDRFDSIFLPKSGRVLNQSRKLAPSVGGLRGSGSPAPPTPTPPPTPDVPLSPYDPRNMSQDPLSLSMDVEMNAIDQDALDEALSRAEGSARANASPSSFPHSPPPTLQPTPSLTPSLSPLDYTPAPRDYARDYEACLVCVEDVDRLVSLASLDRARSARAGHIALGQVTSYDVLPLLREMKDTLDRFFSRHSSGPL